MGFEIRKKRKHVKAEKFVKKIKKIQEKASSIEKITRRNEKICR